MAESCSKCGRARPEVIADPSCEREGYCTWAEHEPDRPCPNHPPPSTLRSCFCTLCGAWKFEGRPLVYETVKARS